MALRTRGVVKKRELNIDVVQAARERLINVFNNGVKVYMSTSGGKDSIVVMHLLYSLILEGKINPAQLEVLFIDEEAMYEDVIDIVKMWRKRFLAVGARFVWYCLEVRHYNCLRNLEDDESFICWDRYQRDKWCRPMPSFAVTSHPKLKPRKDSYQEFSKRAFSDGVILVGVRISESIQRRNYIADSMSANGITNGGLFYPIYDMTDKDVWRYIQQNGVEYPRVYEEMYACGVKKNKLRVCNYLAIDTIGTLSKIYEFRPKLAEAIQRREPNAYLALLYWDSEMFRRNTARRRELEGEDEEKDYKALALDIIKNPHKHTNNEHKLKIIAAYKKTILLKFGGDFDKKIWRAIYESLMAGDTKLRTMRAIVTQIGCQKKDYRE